MLDFEGITVLNVIESSPNILLNIVLVLLICMTWLAVCGLWHISSGGIREIIGNILSTIAAIALSVVLFNSMVQDSHNPEIKYLIEVDNDVSLVEFLDNFEIIEKPDSNIFLVKPLDKIENP